MACGANSYGCILSAIIVANGWAEAIGSGSTLVIGRYVAPALAHATDAASIFGVALIAVVFGALLEGVVVGAAQERRCE